jgi:hypothetical protein
MHYNPVSIALAERCVEEQEGLGAVVVESCESRWRRTQEVSPPGSIGRVLLPSEMLAAAEAAEERGVPISLGDTDVGELGPRLKELLIASLMDLLSPGEGWKRIGDDLRRGAKLAFDTSDLDGDALEFSDFLKPDLLLGFVTSLLAYPAAALVKAPIPVGSLLVGSAFGAHYLEAAAREADALAAAGGDSSASYLLLSAVLIVISCVGINQCVGYTRQFFTKSFLGDDAAVLAPSSGEEPASPRYRAGVASMAWRSTRRFSTNAP